MKTLIIFSLVLLSFQLPYAQDRLKLKNGTTLQVEIVDHSRKSVSFYLYEDETQTLKELPKEQIIGIRYSPDKLTRRKWSWAFSIGSPMLGSQKPLKDLMIQHGFDDPSSGFFTRGPVEHPRGGSNPALGLEAEYLLKPQKGIGVLLSYFNSGEVRGFDGQRTFGHLFVRYRDLALNPFISFYTRSHLLQFRLGPSLHFQQLLRSDAGPEENRIRQTYFRPGLYTEVGASLIERERSYLRFVVGYLYIPGKSAFGPYEEDHYNSFPGSTAVFFPEEKMALSHGLIALRYARKF